MALQKTHNLPSGLSGNYWRIRSIEINVDNVITSIRLGLYRDAAARDGGNTPILHKTYRFDTGFLAADMDILNLYVICYTKIKALSEFSGSTDV